MKYPELKKQVEERIREIKADHKQHCLKTLEKGKIKTAMALCKSYRIFGLAFAWEVSQHCITLLEDIIVDRIEHGKLSEIQMLLVESSNIFNWIMEWSDDQEYCPDITSGDAIDGWLLDCLEEYQNTEAD